MVIYIYICPASSILHEAIRYDVTSRFRGFLHPASHPLHDVSLLLESNYASQVGPAASAAATAAAATARSVIGLPDTVALLS